MSHISIKGHLTHISQVEMLENQIANLILNFLFYYNS
jgi:hypothetical protein